MNREAATKLLAERLTDEVIVTGLGQATLDMQKHADRDLNCYTFGSMGMCSSVTCVAQSSRLKPSLMLKG